MARIFLVDDHALVRDGLRAILWSGGHHVTGEAANAADAVRAITAARHDLVLLDVLLGQHSGFDVLTALVGQPTHPPVLMVTMSERPDDMALARRLGARGYLPKAASRERMLRAVADVLNGGTHFTEMPDKSAPPDRAAVDPDHQRLALLSPRELDILGRVVRGHSSAAIAQALGLSAKTVDTYRSRLMAKTGAADVTALVRFAIRAGVLDVSGH